MGHYTWCNGQEGLGSDGCQQLWAQTAVRSSATLLLALPSPVSAASKALNAGRALLSPSSLLKAFLAFARGC